MRPCLIKKNTQSAPKHIPDIKVLFYNIFFLRCTQKRHIQKNREFIYFTTRRNLWLLDFLPTDFFIDVCNNICVSIYYCRNSYIRTHNTMNKSNRNNEYPYSNQLARQDLQFIFVSFTLCVTCARIPLTAPGE